MESQLKLKKLKLDKTSNITTRVLDSTVDKMREIGKPGTIASDVIREFFNVKYNESTIPYGNGLNFPDDSLLLMAHSKEKVMLTVQKSGQALVLELDEKSVYHLISKLNSLVNTKQN